MKKEYLPRIIDEVIKERLMSAAAVLITGVRDCGKTRTSLEIAKSSISPSDYNSEEDYIKLGLKKPQYFLNGEVPRLIDEWELVPFIWNHLRRTVDNRNTNGQYTLTESISLLDNSCSHLDTLRYESLKMRTMSLFESKDSNGKVSLKSLFEGNTNVDCLSDLSIEDLAKALIKGGWPSSIGEDSDTAYRNIENIVNNVVNNDISKVDNVKKKPKVVISLLKSYAKHTSFITSNQTILKDMSFNDCLISSKIIHNYLRSLENINFIEELPAWSPSLNTKSSLRTSNKRYFTDPSIAAYLLSVSISSFYKDWSTFNILLKSLCIRDLRIYCMSLKGQVYYFQDENDFGVDAIIQLLDGRWTAIEIRIDSNEIDKAAKKLIRLKDEIDKDKMNEPSFLMVLTCTRIAYKREDGVLVIPVGCLRD